MSPHVKTLLSLLMVVFTKLKLVHTFDPESVDAARFSGDTLGESSFASTTTNTRNDLGDEGREARRCGIHGHGFLTGKQLVNSDNTSEQSTELIIPKHLEENSEKVMAMKAEYKSLEIYREALAARISQVLDPWEPPGKNGASGLLNELKKYHEKYMLVVEDQRLRSNINPTKLSDDSAQLGEQQTQSGRIEDLRKILHGTFQFPHPSEHHTLDLISQERLLYIKKTFEKCVFNTVDYQYQFQLISREEMKSFFEVPETLQLTARHINDLFSVPQQALTAYHTLIPQMGVILNDWHTEHLHRCLRELDPDSEQYLVYKTLQVVVQNFGKSRMIWIKNDRTESINKFFSHENFLRNFQQWSPRALSPDSVEVQEDLMGDNIKKVIHIFDVGRVSSIRDSVLEVVESQELLLNYYILRFIRGYGNESVKKFAENLIDRAKLVPRLDWVEVSLNIHRLTNIFFDYGYFLAYPEKARVVAPKTLSVEAQQAVGKQVKVLKKRFTTLTQLLGASNKPRSLQSLWWHSGLSKTILSFMHQIEEYPETPLHQNSWLVPWVRADNSWLISWLRTKKFRKSGDERLGNILYEHYNGADLELLGIYIHDIFEGEQSKIPSQSFHQENNKRQRINYA